MVAVKIIRKGQKNLVLATLYLKPGDTNRYNKMLRNLKPLLKKWIDIENMDVIFGGDFMKSLAMNHLWQNPFTYAK